MSNDRFSQCLGEICGKKLGDSFEAIITDAYPRLADDSELRHRYADYLEKQDTVSAYNTICALSKMAKSTKDLAQQDISETQRDPEQLLERLLPEIKTMSETSVKIIEGMESPLLNNILSDTYGYLFAQTLYLNEFNPNQNNSDKGADSDAVARQIASCIRSSDVPQFVKIIEDSSDITAKSMMLIGNLHPKFRELAAVKDPEITEFCKLAATFPRSTFTACAEMKLNNEQIQDFKSFLTKVSSPDIIEKAQSLDRVKADMIFKSLDMTKPVPPTTPAMTPPQNTSGGRE